MNNCGMPKSISALCFQRVQSYRSTTGFQDSSAVIDQPPDINTRELCLDACLGPNKDGLLASGQSCLTAHFSDSHRKCQIAISHKGLWDRDDTLIGIRYEVHYLCSAFPHPGEWLLIFDP